MEALLHYCWKHRLLPLGELTTTDGQAIEVIDPGIHNHDAGPDFFNAKVRIDGEMWVGNVEIHTTSKDWYAHHHDEDNAYENVILHVVKQHDDVEVRTKGGRLIPEMLISVPQKVKDNYRALLDEDSYPPCYRIVPELTPLLIHSWMAALQTERLQRKTDDVTQRLAQCDGSWEAAYFVTLARGYGFGHNGDALELWARSIPLHAVDHHRDDLLQIEAIFFGQAGLLDDVKGATSRSTSKASTSSADTEDAYLQRLRSEYTFLKHKFGLQPIDATMWKFMRMRPQNFPHVRIAQLARLYHEGRCKLSKLLDCNDTEALRDLFHCGVSEYWETHYTFASSSAPNSKYLSAASANGLMINVLIPMLFAYGRMMCREHLCEKAFDLLESLKPESNNITRMWQEVGLEVRSAGDSQALIQLKKQYCDRKDCLRCRIGYEYMKKKQ